MDRIGILAQLKGEKITTSPDSTRALGTQLGKVSPPGSIICLFGDLGSGKTTFIQGVASQITGTPLEQINSPTFVYLNIYGTQEKVFHFDLYRLRDADAFMSMGFEEFLYAGGICCIEWSERIEALLPSGCLHVRISHISEGQRKVQISLED